MWRHHSKNQETCAVSLHFPLFQSSKRSHPTCFTCESTLSPQLLLLHLLVPQDAHTAHPVVVPLMAVAMAVAVALAMVPVALVALVAVAMALVTVAVAVDLLQLLLQALAHVHQHLLQTKRLGHPSKWPRPKGVE